MGDFYRAAVTRKAIKTHRCHWCGEVIAEGEAHQEQTGVWDELAFRNRFHNECFEALCSDDEEEFTAFSQERPRD
jgi:hypothetical protein